MRGETSACRLNRGWKVDGAGHAGTRRRVESPAMSATSAPAATRAPNPVLVAVGRVLEGALNRVVALDVETSSRLSGLDGRALTLDFKGALPSMRIAVEGARLRIGPGFEGDSALRVAATPGALLGLAFARGRDGAIAPGRVEIAGDAELARRLERLAANFAPDFDEAFARAFGDVAGFRIARAVRGALGWSRASVRAFAQDAAEFLSEEGRDLVPRAQLDGFLDEVDALRERAERLEARLRRLGAAIEPRGA